VGASSCSCVFPLHGSVGARPSSRSLNVGRGSLLVGRCLVLSSTQWSTSRAVAIVPTADLGCSSAGLRSPPDKDAFTLRPPCLSESLLSSSVTCVDEWLRLVNSFVTRLLHAAQRSGRSLAYHPILAHNSGAPGLRAPRWWLYHPLGNRSRRSAPQALGLLLSPCGAACSHDAAASIEPDGIPKGSTVRP
jgi:hypothetical protein